MGDYIDLEFFQDYTRTEYTASTVPTADTVNEYIDLSEKQINEDTGRTWGVVTNTAELYDAPNQDLLLKSTPVLAVSEITDINGDVLTEGIDEAYIVDNDFVLFTCKQSRAYVTYTSGYTDVRAIVKKLTAILTLQFIVQSESASTDNTESISVGPISFTSSIGATAVVNLDTDADKYWSKLRRLIR